MGSEWQEVLLGEACESIQTGPFGSQLHQSDYVAEGIPSIMPVNISDNRITTDGIARITEADAQRLSKYLVKTGDVVYSRRGDVERRALVREGEDGWLCGTGCLRVRFDKKLVDSEYASFQLGSPFAREWIVRHAVGATMPNLNTSILSALPFILPPLPEQKAIAYILGSLDDKIELNRRMNATLEGLAQALFQSWFVDFDPVLDNALAAGNPIPDELTDRAAVRRQALDNGTANREAAQHFPATFQFTEELGWIPEGWEISCVGNHVSLQRGKTYKSSLKGLPGPYLLGLGAIQRNGGFKEDKLITYGGDSPDNITLEPGDIFVSLKDLTQAADLLGSVARIPPHIPSGRLTQDTVKLVFDKRPISRDYIYNSLLTSRYRTYCKDYSTGTTNLGLAREDFFSYPFAKPTDLIQSTYENFVQSTKLKHQSNTGEEKTLTNLRDTLLPQLISGELRTENTRTS